MVIYKKIVNFLAAFVSLFGWHSSPELSVPRPATYHASLYHNATIEQFHDYTGASILPMGYLDALDGRDLYIVLGREAQGIDKGTYDDFGGSRDNTENNPLDTAVREFYEETIASTTMSMKVPAIREYVGLQQKHTKHVLVEWFWRQSGMRPYVTYITEFNQAQLNGLIQKFYTARRWSFQSKYLEKDRIAFVSYNTFIQTIDRTNPDLLSKVNVRVSACVLNPHTRDMEKQMITLRPFLVKKLYKFAHGTKPSHGLDQRIRIYNL